VSRLFESLSPIAISFARASELSSISRSKLRALARTGELKTVRIGSRRVVPIDALRQLCNVGTSAAATQESVSVQS